MSHIRALCLLGFLAAFSSSALASRDCPLIRPAGLSEQQVNAVVTNIYAQALKRPPQTLDTSKTLKMLDGTENAILTYSFASLSVGETLGFDAIRTFYDAAKAKGGNQPFETLTLAELQSLARTAYLKEPDKLPPEATEGKSYKVQSLGVQAPSPVAGWRLLQCGSDRVTFQRQTPKAISTAGVRVAGLPPFRSDSAFLSTVSELLSKAAPPGFQLQPWEPRRAKTETPCADATLIGQGSAGELFLRARICYEDKGASFGYATLFSHVATEPGHAPSIEAEAFIASASAQ
jgi:hypothetical protein